MVATQGVRPATEGELDLLPDVYERASFNPRLAAVDRFARAALGGEVFVAERDGGLAGASGCAASAPPAGSALWRSCRRRAGPASGTR